MSLWGDNREVGGELVEELSVGVEDCLITVELELPGGGKFLSGSGLEEGGDECQLRPRDGESGVRGGLVAGVEDAAVDSDGSRCRRDR